VTQLYLGNLISEVKCFQDAETLLRRSLEDPRGKSSVSAGNLCVALIKQGRFEEALEHGRIATKLALNERPVNANAFHHMGFALYCLSLPQLAVEYCSLSVLIKPRYSEAYFTRGLAKKAIGKFALTKYSGLTFVQKKDSKRKRRKILKRHCYYHAQRQVQWFREENGFY
jgi:tetratricopeptide (TPR) repeat protein